MFGIDSSEFLLIAVVALLVIGPKDLPRVMRLVGGWVGRGRAMTRHLRSGFDTMMREAELEEMQKQWAKQNADIMAATQLAPVGAHANDAAGGEHPYDHSGAMPFETVDLTDRNCNPGEGNWIGEAVPAMTGPQPAPHLLVEGAAEPAIPLEPQPAPQPSP